MTDRIDSENDAIGFMKKVKFALRYNSAPTLPLASMYGAARDTRRAIELRNESGSLRQGCHHKDPKTPRGPRKKVLDRGPLRVFGSLR
jgi:hypothetical protein